MAYLRLLTLVVALLSPTPPPVPTCNAGEVLNDAGRCVAVVCGDNEALNDAGRCVAYFAAYLPIVAGE